MVTRVVMLGTGTPFPDPERSGPATAVIVDDFPYLVDFGPGVVRRMMAAYQRGVGAFGRAAVNVTTAFRLICIPTTRWVIPISSSRLG